jgi:hypothetical protein
MTIGGGGYRTVCKTVIAEFDSQDVSLTEKVLLDFWCWGVKLKSRVVKDAPICILSKQSRFNIRASVFNMATIKRLPGGNFRDSI